MAPVFGPDRPRAARQAITELQAARSALPTWPYPDNPAATERYRRALANREQYTEYGDTFQGH